MNASLKEVLGPRVPEDEYRAHRWRYLIPGGLFVLAAALLIGSIWAPYWRMRLYAPQYPRGLYVIAYLDKLEGDVREIDGLNHYIGMRPLNDAAQLERRTAKLMVAVLTGLLCAAMFVHSRWAVLPAAPAVIWPFGFLIDLHLWMAHFGTNLDPTAPLSGAIKPFVPPVLGEGTIGQFRTVSRVDTGWWLGLAASVVVLTGLWFHRRAYKPLHDRRTRRPSLLAGLAIVLAAPHVAAFDLQEAVRTAAPGAELHVPPGRYPAPLVLDRPVTLISDGRAVIDARGEGDGIRIEAPDVTLRGLVIRDSGSSLDRENAGIVIAGVRATVERCVLEDVLLGIVFKGAHDAVVRNTVVRGKPLELGRRGDALRVWESDRVRIENNLVVGCRDVVVWFSEGTHLIGNEVRGNRYGMHFMYAEQSLLEDNYLHHNSTGVFLMYSAGSILRRNVLSHNRGPSGYGIGLKDMDSLTAEDNLIAGNRVGVFNDNSPQRIDVWNEFRGNHVVFNDTALAFLPSVRRNRFTGNAFAENSAQIGILGSGTFEGNEFTVDGRGNYWSDYAGYDADGDGVGDVPYRNSNLFESWMDRAPNLRLFLHGPAQQAVQFAAHAFPIMRPEPRITDGAPLMAAPRAVARVESRSSRVPFSLLGVALLACGSTVLLLVRGGASAPVAPARPADLAASGPGPDGRRSVPAPADPIVRVSDLRMRFGPVVAVDGLTFDVPAGQTLGLWGGNGAGKTTVIKCLLGLHRAEGTMSVGGLDVRTDGKRVRHAIGYVPQEFVFDEDVTAQEALAFLGALRGVPADRGSVVLDRVGLSDHAAKRVGDMSGGMKQRLALATALLSDPPVLLLDEPTSNLDVAARAAFLELLRSLRHAGKTIVFTTHRAEEALSLADRLLVLDRGRLTFDGRPEELLREHIAAEVRLGLAIRREEHARAEELLREAGYRVSRNCELLHVISPADDKAGAIQLLARAGVRVSDFHLEDV